MPNNYSPGTPVDKFGIPKTIYPPAKISLATTNNTNASTSSILLLSHDTTEIEVVAVSSVQSGDSTGIAGKWLSQATVDSSVAGTSVITAAGTANFDFVVQAGQVRRFVVPIATQNQAQQSIQGVNRLLGLYPAVAYKVIAGTGSVITMEF